MADDSESTAAPAPKPAKPDPAQQAAAAKDAAVDALIEQWLAPLLGGAIAQHTPAWNELTAALPALKAAIIEQGG